MPDDVKIEVTGDVKKAEAAFDKLNAIVAKQGAQIEKLQSKTKQATDAGASGFQNMSNEIGKMATRAIGLTAVMAGIYKTFTATIDKMKEIRVDTDEAKISTDESLRKVYKQFELTTSDQQEKMKRVIFGAAQSKGMKISDVAENFMQQGLNGASAEELHSQKYNQGLDLQKATGVKDNKSIEDMIKTYNMNRGILKATPDQRKEAFEGLAQYGSEVEEYRLLSASLAKVKGKKKMSNDEMYVAYDMMKDTASGKEKQSAGAIASAYEKGGIEAVIKATGRSKEDFYKEVENQQIKTKGANALKIENDSVQTLLNKGKNAKDIAFSDSYGNTTEKQLEDERKAKEQSINMSLTDRMANSFATTIFGEDKGQSYAPTEENLQMMLGGFVNDLRGWSASLNAETAKSLSNKPIDMKRDTQLNVRVKR